MQRLKRLIVRLAATFLILGTAAPAAASEFTPDDSQVAVTRAAEKYDIDVNFLDCIAYWESDGTYDPAARGDWSPRRGRYESRGVAQIHDRGLLASFLAWGYTSRDNPYQSMDFVARWISTYGYGPPGAGQWAVVGVFC